MAPIGAWSAATGSTALMPWLLFLIIFLWTPPHFWSLALRFKDDYQKAGLPMLPNVKGDRKTLTQILLYSIALFGASLLPLAVQFGWIYMTTAVTMGTVFVAKTWQAKRSNDPKQVWGVFKFSILYLFLLLFSLIVDAFV
jgi:protoheme IX farnesyltransferase